MRIKLDLQFFGGRGGGSKVAKGGKGGGGKAKVTKPEKGKITQSRPRVKDANGNEHRGRVTTLTYKGKTHTFENMKAAKKYAKENNIELE